MKFLEEVNILEVGNTIQLAGAIFAKDKKYYMIMFPWEFNEVGSYKTDIYPATDLEEWNKIIRQTDLLETQMIEKSPDGKLTKIIMRKSARQINQGVSWEVFKRDNYECRYCGIDGVPMTVDHIIIWEQGGPSTKDNLFTTCRKCNKIRGDMPYEEWINSDRYKERSKNLRHEIHLANIDKIKDLNLIQKVKNIKSR